jgi:23S rRNA (guanine1835-N2)-methyltransferase
MHSITFRNKEFFLERYPKTSNKSLLPFNNADLLALNYLENRENIQNMHLFNDRFGVWSCVLNDIGATSVLDYASQVKSILQNVKRNELPERNVHFKTSLDGMATVDFALVKIPKSSELFQLYLQEIHEASEENVEVVCAFMTKFFNPSLLKIASKYFEDVSQSLAWKKARLLILKQPKKDVVYSELKKSIPWKDQTLQQYYGVFSSGKVDIGTQFLLEDLSIDKAETEILDLASGNGIIANEAMQLNPKANLTLVDDSMLAIESSKLNIKNARFVCADNLSGLPKNHFDLVVSNPPFHFEHENNIEVSLNLFRQVFDCLKPNGRFVLVANKHLNYSTHLRKLFAQVSALKSNAKFEVLECKG